MSGYKNGKKYFFLQCIVFFLWSATCLSSIGDCSSLEAIALESLRPSYSPQKGRPLPLVGHWNCGDRPGGFGPEFQLRLLQNKHHILPWVRLPASGKSSFYDRIGQPAYCDIFSCGIYRAALLYALKITTQIGRASCRERV